MRFNLYNHRGLAACKKPRGSRASSAEKGLKNSVKKR